MRWFPCKWVVWYSLRLIIYIVSFVHCIIIVWLIFLSVLNTRWCFLLQFKPRIIIILILIVIIPRIGMRSRLGHCFLIIKYHQRRQVIRKYTVLLPISIIVLISSLFIPFFIFMFIFRLSLIFRFGMVSSIVNLRLRLRLCLLFLYLLLCDICYFGWIQFYMNDWVFT